MRRFLSLFTVLMLCGVFAMGQSRVVTGRVTDANGAGIPLATVTETGTKNVVVADAEGNYTITLQGNSGITITATGFNAASTRAANNNGNVSLVRTDAALEEVVVTALGIRKKADQVGYSTARVDEKLLNNGRAPNLATGLSGKVSGLTINNNGSGVQQSPRIVIRGLRSLTGDNTALIVLDGVPVPANAINYINPNDIERVDIMKGGQAATLFGSDGVNGAVVITTKKGSKRPEFNASISMNTERVAYLPKFQHLFGSGSAYGANMKENWNAAENQQYGDRYDGSTRSFGRALPDGSVQTGTYSDISNSRRSIWNDGFSRQADVSYRAGDAISNIFMSYQNLKSEGVVPGDVYERNVFRMNSGRTYNKLTLSFDANYSFDKANTTLSDFYFFALNSAGWIPQSSYADWQTNKFADPSGYFNDYYNNPYYSLDNARSLQKTNNFQANVKAVYKVTEDLGVTARVALANTTSFTTNEQNRYSFTDWSKSKAYAFDYLYDVYEGGSYGGGRAVANTPIQGGVGEGTSYGNRMSYDLFANYSKQLRQVSFDLIVGGGASTRTSKSVSTSTSAILFPNYYNLTNSFTGLYNGSNSRSEQRKISGFADATVGFKKFVYLHGTFRRDYSSLFSDELAGFANPSFNYYGGDISIILSNIFPALGNSAVVDNIKLRGGYNKNGNDNLSAYALRQIYPIGTGFPYNGLPGSTIGNTLVSPDLTPEFVKTAEVGVELSFFKGRINFEASAYKQKSERQILNVNIDPSSGYSSYLLNAADVDNKGYELDLKIIPLSTRNSTLNVNFNFAYNTNVVNELYAGGGLTNLQYQAPDARASLNAVVGEMFPSLQVTRFLRDNGKIIVDSALGSPRLDPNKVTVGSTLPKYNLGVGFNYRYKSITISANAEYRGGSLIYHDLGTDMAFTGSGAATSIYQRESFVWPNSVVMNNGKYVPNTNTAVNPYIAMYTLWGDVSNSNGLSGVGEMFYSSGDFWKLRDLSLTYDVPASVFGGKTIKGASISFWGRNLVTILAKDNWYTDPELSNTAGNSQGINTSLNTPPTRQFGGTVKLTF